MGRPHGINRLVTNEALEKTLASSCARSVSDSLSRLILIEVRFAAVRSALMSRSAAVVAGLVLAPRVVWD
jgi:hypothetical protein